MVGRDPHARSASTARPVSQTGDWHASGRRRSPSSTMKPRQPSTALRSVSSSNPWPSAASAMIPQTHGGWIPPHEPSASCRSRIHCSATAYALRRSGRRPARRPRPARDRADLAQVDVGVPHRPQRLRDRERDERLSRPAGEVVDRERRRRRQEHELGRDRHHPLPRPLADEREEALREEAALRDAALAAGCSRARAGRDRRRSIRSATYASIDVERSAGPSNQIAQVPSSRMRADELVRDPRSSSGVRSPRKWFQKRCCAVIVTFDSSSPTQMPSGRWSSSRRRVPRSIASSRRVELGGGGHAVMPRLRRTLARRARPRRGRCAPRSPSSRASPCRSRLRRGRRRAGRCRRRDGRRPGAARRSRRARG